MSITLDVNAFLNKDVCAPGCDDMAMEKEMETNIFEEIEHLLKFNKNLEYETQNKQQEATKKEPKKVEELKNQAIQNLDFLNTTSDDFLLTSDSQGLLGEDTLLFTVEQDRLQPISSRFMVPGIYKRIEGVSTNDLKSWEVKPCNVFLSEMEKQGRIVNKTEFEELYIMAEELKETNIKRVILVEPMEDIEDEEEQLNELKDKFQSPEGLIPNDKDKIPKEWDALNRLAYDILKLTNRDHIVIDRKKNEIIRTQFNTQQKTIYRFLSPESLGLKPSPESEDKIINLDEESKNEMPPKSTTKLGRPKKRAAAEEPPKKTCKNIKKINKTTKTIEDNKLTINPNTNLRTRSGRLIKKPPTVQENPKLPIELAPPSPQESLSTLLNDLKDSDYHCSKIDSLPPKLEANITLDIPAEQTTPATKRKIPPEAICPTCKKIFLGRRLQRHFTQHPDHMKIEKTTPIITPEFTPTNNIENNLIDSSPTESSEDMSLFKFLISKLQKSPSLNEDQKADLFLNELNDLVEQLQLRSSRLIRNTSGLHFVNQRCSKLLGIPEGQYALDLTAIEQPIDDPDLHTNYDNSNSQTHHHHHHHSQSNNISSRSLDYTHLSITLDDTITDEAAQKLNLSVGGKLLPPSEESLLRAVGDLVHTDINKIHTSSMLQQQTVANSSLTTSSSNNSNVVVANLLPPHIDHASDNAVEAVNMKETSTNVNPSENPLLDLSVDFFQFNN